MNAINQKNRNCVAIVAAFLTVIGLVAVGAHHMAATLTAAHQGRAGCVEQAERMFAK